MAKLYIENVSAFNRMFGASIIYLNKHSIYDIDITLLDGIKDESHFWEICYSDNGLARSCTVIKAEEIASIETDKGKSIIYYLDGGELRTSDGESLDTPIFEDRQDAIDWVRGAYEHESWGLKEL